MFTLVLGTCSKTTHNLLTQQAIMEAAICTLVAQFKSYAGKDGASSTLSKEEFQNLVIAQLPNYVKNASDPKAIEELMGSLDENNDGELTFSEFWQLIGNLASKQGGFTQ
ncbi:protein S100-A11 [Xyrichtys novacula]|uniref:Protein S100-A11 n=1 Tax=Xyrichtys novacula TaxID=13765 RepID=A0AAV1HG07_XYRNO|nr:protein S100-A11 [Xyrichtys novacula]